MLDTDIEQPIPLSLAAKETPNRTGGRGINACTIWRWAIKGCKGIRLETAMIGGVRMTSREAMRRFFSSVTAVADGKQPPARTSRQREKSISAAERELAST